MPVELIAEVASSHAGDIELAKAFIWAYAAAGADFVKFQSYQVKTLRPNDPQREWLAKAELSDDAHHILKAECEKAGTRFLTTVFHASRVPFLASLGLKAIKIGSGEAGESTLREAARRAFPRVLISMGATGGAIVPEDDARDCEWLRCVSRYPASAWMCEQASYPRYIPPHAFKEVGWSDHCVGVEICKKAIFKGASLIEKHVSLPQQPRPVRAFEATVDQFRELRAFADDDPSRFLGRWQHGD